MTFQILDNLSVELYYAIRGHLTAVIEPQLEADVSNYARGRMRAWIPYQAPLSAVQSWQSAAQSPRLWSWIQRTCARYDFIAETALVSRGGEITRHRDAAYADYRAIGINFGVCNWHYELCYPEFSWTPNAPQQSDEQIIPLTGGEIFEFNCKNPHWVSDVEETRWGINVWHISDKARQKFTEQCHA